MAKKSTEEKRPVKNILVKGKVKYVELTEQEINKLQKLAAETVEQEG